MHSLTGWIYKNIDRLHTHTKNKHQSVLSSSPHLASKAFLCHAQSFRFSFNFLWVQYWHMDSTFSYWAQIALIIIATNAFLLFIFAHAHCPRINATNNNEKKTGETRKQTKKTDWYLHNIILFFFSLTVPSPPPQINLKRT